MNDVFMWTWIAAALVFGGIALYCIWCILTHLTKMLIELKKLKAEIKEYEDYRNDMIRRINDNLKEKLK